MKEQAAVRRHRVHGSVPLNDRQRFEREGRPLLDLSANVSPYGAAPVVIEALRQVELGVYPDPRCWAARQAVEARFGVSASQVAVGNGAAELIWTTVRALLAQGGRALEVRPIFGEFSAAVAACGAPLEVFHALEQDDFRYSMAGLDMRLREVGPRVCYLCSPNNPTGVPLPFAEVTDLAKRHPDTVFLLDQAYLGLSPRFQELELLPPPNVICLRSLTKEQGLPGVRVGYLIAAEEIVGKLDQHRASWMVNTMAQAVVEAAMADPAEHVASVRTRMMADRARLEGLLVAAGFETVPGESPFVLVGVEDPAALCAYLLHEHGIAIRNCASFGLLRHVRFSSVQEHNAPRLAHALQGWREGAGLGTS